MYIHHASSADVNTCVQAVFSQDRWNKVLKIELRSYNEISIASKTGEDCGLTGEL